VYLHGLVRDAQRQKMSKSKGNVINPLDVADKYGTDALRMALLVGNTPGQDMALAEDKIKGYKLFANKVWNIARFVLENAGDADMEAPYTHKRSGVLDSI
jgi:valyl-tRNA synthetase